MTRVRGDRLPRPFRAATARRLALATCTVAGVGALAACGSSPVAMTDHPITSSTPSRAAGAQLQRSADAEKSCPTAPAAAESAASHPVAGVDVPADPHRVLALGVGAADTACALGLQGALVGTSPLPRGTETYLPDAITRLPVLDPASPGLAAAADALKPDLVLTTDRTVADRLGGIAPVVVYPDDPASWQDATRTVADALDRPAAGRNVLLSVLRHAQDVTAGQVPRDTRVSLVDAGAPDRPVLMPADSLGSLMLEAVGAGRPPAQRTHDGKLLGPAPDSPAVGDPFDGDVIFAVCANGTPEEDQARRVFATDRWKALAAVKDKRVFMVDRAVWDGRGPTAANAVIGDIDGSINGIAPDG